ncbi:flagellar biosynthesis protein FliQ [Piscinibacter terrae]|uniref:Flagellar biosynthetic protein FliQ n=1 Tax=Piscinibacter terrae TaxID=2496871 RepID=A0A3N7HW82_9BURK|nr:flagellar biosynthesis protein FliQ [Albitalea terrae]RQP26650.1 flagellar biosynthetic protein FliQ [Albitalea terrae]
MRSDLAAQLFGELLVNAAIIAAPLLICTLLVGLVVSVLQVVTQIQETSLTFIPKLIAAVLVLIVAGPWMLKRLAEYATRLIANIPNYL